MALAGQGIGVGGLDRAGVAEQAAEDVGQKVGEQGGFLEFVRPPGRDKAGPVLEFGLPIPYALRQVEGPHLLAHNLGMEQGLGFDSHCRSFYTKTGSGSNAAFPEAPRSRPQMDTDRHRWTRQGFCGKRGNSAVEGMNLGKILV